MGFGGLVNGRALRPLRSIGIQVTNLVEHGNRERVFLPGQPDYALPGFKKTSYLKFLIGWIG